MGSEASEVDEARGAMHTPRPSSTKRTLVPKIKNLPLTQRQPNSKSNSSTDGNLKLESQSSQSSSPSKITVNAHTEAHSKATTVRPTVELIVNPPQSIAHSELTFKRTVKLNHTQVWEPFLHPSFFRQFFHLSSLPLPLSCRLTHRKSCGIKNAFFKDVTLVFKQPKPGGISGSSS